MLVARSAAPHPPPPRADALPGIAGVSSARLDPRERRRGAKTVVPQQTPRRPQTRGRGRPRAQALPAAGLRIVETASANANRAQARLGGAGILPARLRRPERPAMTVTTACPRAPRSPAMPRNGARRERRNPAEGGARDRGHPARTFPRTAALPARAQSLRPSRQRSELPRHAGETPGRPGGPRLRRVCGRSALPGIAGVSTAPEPRRSPQCPATAPERTSWVRGHLAHTLATRNGARRERRNPAEGGARDRGHPARTFPRDAALPRRAR